MNTVIIGACADCYETWKGRPSVSQETNDWFAGAVRACELSGDVLIVDNAPHGYECEVCCREC